MLIKINKGIIDQKIGKIVVIYDPERSALYTFNEIASLIFLSLKRKLSKEKIIKKIASDYKVSLQIATEDYDKFLTKLLKKKIISI